MTGLRAGPGEPGAEKRDDDAGAPDIAVAQAEVFPGSLCDPKRATPRGMDRVIHKKTLPSPRRSGTKEPWFFRGTTLFASRKDATLWTAHTVRTRSRGPSPARPTNPIGHSALQLGRELQPLVPRERSQSGAPLPCAAGGGLLSTVIASPKKIGVTPRGVKRNADPRCCRR